MNAFFAAGMFDNQWLVLIIVIIGALANLLAKRREEQPPKPRPSGEEPPPSSRKPPRDFDLEEAMRELLGEKPPVQTPAPPPIPRPEARELPPWQEEGEPLRPTAPPSPPPVIAAARERVAAIAASEEEAAPAARRFEPSNEPARHPATGVHGQRRRSRTGEHPAAQWRDPRSARQAFVAALVFGPPKGLEP